MSSKKIYEAGRFLASRYAAGRWRGIGAAAAVSYSGGWIAETRQKVLIAETRNRVWIAGKK